MWSGAEPSLVNKLGTAGVEVLVGVDREGKERVGRRTEGRGEQSADAEMDSGGARFMHLTRRSLDWLRHY